MPKGDGGQERNPGAKRLRTAAAWRFPDHIRIEWTTGPDNGCTAITANWYEFTGQTWEQVQGHGWGDAVHPEDIAGIMRKAQTAWEHRAPYAAVFRLRHYSGKYRWVIVQAKPIFDGKQMVGLNGRTDVLPPEWSIADPETMIGISHLSPAVKLWLEYPQSTRDYNQVMKLVVQMAAKRWKGEWNTEKEELSKP